MTTTAMPIVVHEQWAPRVYAFGLTAYGVTQSDSYKVSANRNAYMTVNPGASVTLDAATQPEEVCVSNYSANTLTVYPPFGYAINAGTVNASVTIAAGTSMTFISGDPTGPNVWSR